MDPCGATAYSLLSHLWPRGTTWEVGCRQELLWGNRKKTSQLGLEPSSPIAVFLKLVSLPGEVGILGELSTEHPSPRQQGEGGGGGRGVHLLQEGRSLCFGTFGHVGSPAEWQEGELGIPTVLTLLPPLCISDFILLMLSKAYFLYLQNEMMYQEQGLGEQAKRGHIVCREFKQTNRTNSN